MPLYSPMHDLTAAYSFLPPVLLLPNSSCWHKELKRLSPLSGVYALGFCRMEHKAGTFIAFWWLTLSKYLWLSFPFWWKTISAFHSAWTCLTTFMARLFSIADFSKSLTFSLGLSGRQWAGCPSGYFTSVCLLRRFIQCQLISHIDARLATIRNIFL